MGVQYDSYFERIPDSVFVAISSGCQMGDRAYGMIFASEPKLFESKYAASLRNRIHDKALQAYLEDKLSGESGIKVEPLMTSFGNCVASIKGDRYRILPCRVRNAEDLPMPAKYKVAACECNPDDDASQISLFDLVDSGDRSYVQFLLTLFFAGEATKAALVLPNRSMTAILTHRQIVYVPMSVEDMQYQERKLPQLIAEVAKDAAI